MNDKDTIYEDATLIIDEDDPLRQIIELNGNKTQLLKAVEELGELCQAICKYLIYEETPAIIDHLAEEYVDVSIMLEQIGLMFEENRIFRQMAQDYRHAKIERIRSLVDKEAEWRKWYGN